MINIPWYMNCHIITPKKYIKSMQTNELHYFVYKTLYLMILTMTYFSL